MDALPEWLKPIVTIARETGLRLSNIINLEWSQVNIFSRMINLATTKNGDPHSVPMTDNVLNILKKLYSSQNSFRIKSKNFCPSKVLGVFQSGDNCPPERHVGQATKLWFFPARPSGHSDGEKPKTKPVLVNRHWVSKSFKDTGKKAEIENFRFHDLRHDFCSKLVQMGADLYSVAGLAGHRDVKTTQRYAHLSLENLRSTIQKLN